VSLSSFEDNLKSITDSFSQSQQVSYARWKNVIEKINGTRDDYKKARDTFNKWDNLNQIFIVISVIVPIITTSLTSTLNLNVWANLLSAVFPILVGLVRGKSKVWGQKRDGYSNLISQYERLVYDVVEDIYSNRYTTEVEARRVKDLADLDAERTRIGGLA
jgi:hypothetical protein